MNGAVETSRPGCAWRDTATAHVLGNEDLRESERYFAHLSDCADCRAELAQAQLDVAEADLALARRSASRIAPPSPELRARLQNAVSSRARSESGLDRTWTRWTAGLPSGASREGLSSGLYAIASGEGRWEPVGIDGIEVKRLAHDPARRVVTMLIRMAAGTAYPRHRHASDEECFVISGDLRVGERVLGPGDYQLAARDSIHEVQATERGCLLYITSSQDDELV